MKYIGEMLMKLCTYFTGLGHKVYYEQSCHPPLPPSSTCSQKTSEALIKSSHETITQNTP